jgi:hypothetical protein
MVGDGKTVAASIMPPEIGSKTEDERVRQRRPRMAAIAALSTN